MFGEGSYALSAVKQITVTEDFMELDQNQKKCQTKETFEDCKTKLYLGKLEKECNCIPYRLKNFTDFGKVISFSKTTI